MQIYIQNDIRNVPRLEVNLSYEEMLRNNRATLLRNYSTYHDEKCLYGS